MSANVRCHYCGMRMGVEGGNNVHPHCHDAAYYAKALAKVRAMPEPPRWVGQVDGRHMKRAVRRVGLERYLERLTAEART